MNCIYVSKSTLSGLIRVPPSKSQTLRAILFGALAEGKTTVYHPLNSPDTLAMIEACKSFGAQIVSNTEQIEIIGVNGKVDPSSQVIDAGNSGIVLRFLSAVLALGHQPVTLTGDASIQSNRNMQPLIEGLNQLGATLHSKRNNGLAPLDIQGPITSGQATICGKDSQPVSALLIACSFAQGPFTLNILDPGEKPWIDLTLHWLDRLNLQYKRNGYTRYDIPGSQAIKAFDYEVPGDFSSMAFPLTAALLTGSELTIENIDPSDLQGDKKILTILEHMGATFEWQNSTTLRINQNSSLQGVEVDLNDAIDALPILSVVGCFAKGTTRIRNVAVARTKECDRISSTATELKKMGAQIEELEDGLIIHQSKLKGAEVNSHNDHRMALSLSVAGLASEGQTRVLHSECISKTYPTFVQDFQRIRADIKEIR